MKLLVNIKFFLLHIYIYIILYISTLLGVTEAGFMV